MHPEIERDGPGDCPICGMALEPKAVPAADAGPNPELVDFRRRFAVGAALTVPLLVIAMGPMLGLPVEGWIGARAARWAELALATPVVLWCGWPFLKRGWRSFRTWQLNMFSLIALGVAAAWLFSVAAVLAPGAFPAGFRDHHGQVGVYFEAAAVIVVLVLLGQILELGARERTGAAIRALLGLAPKTARIVRADGSEAEVPLEHVRVGDRLRVRPGEKVPVDGDVLEGRSAVDESHADRRAGAGGEGAGRRCHGRDAERPRQPGDRGAAGRGRHGAGADRRDGRAGAALARADPEARGRRRRLVRAGGDRRGCARLRRPGRSGGRRRRSPMRWSRRSRC